MNIFFANRVTNHDEYYKNSGFEITYDPNSHCNFCGPIIEESLDIVKNYCTKNNIFHLNFDILDKINLIETCKDLGIPTLPMVLLDSLEKLEQFANGPFIIKPSLGNGSYTGDDIGYKIFDSVEDFLQKIKNIPNFFEKKKYYIQKSVVNSDELPVLLVVQGFINGKQQIIYNDIVENFQLDGNPVLTNDKDLSEEEITLIKEYTKNILITNNISNTPFTMQFIRKINEPFYAIDFQYRLGFDYYGILINNPHIKDLLDFTYDLKDYFNFEIYSYLKKIDQINISNPQVNKLCKEMNICVVSNYGSLLLDNEYIHRPKKFQNLTFSVLANSRNEAKNIMDDFEEKVKQL